MKKLYFLLLIPVIPVFMILMANSAGSVGGKTGSPGDGGTTCTQCHTGTANPVTGWITTNVPVSGYIPGNTYTITLSGTHTGVVKFGFEVTAEDASNTKVGSWVITDPTQTQLTNGTNAVTHTSAGNTPSGNMKVWTVDWTAPTGVATDITFYAAFNAANGDFGTAGDVIYTTSTTISQQVNPEITGIVPDNADQGESISVSISGSETSWTGSPSVTLSFSGNPGEVITGTNVTATNATTITADFTIPADASPGLWDVNVDALTLEDGFTVNEVVPAITFMSPNTAFPGDMFTGSINGENTEWTGTNPTVYLAFNANPSETIDGTNVVVISDTQIQADFDIPSGASIGNYDIHVDDLVRDNGFTVLQPAASLTGVNPSTGGQGSMVMITIAGEHTSFTGGVTDVYLSFHDNPTEMIDATSFNVVNDTSISAEFDIPADASTGLWDMNVDDLVLENAFTVTEVIVLLTSIDPSSATQGDMIMTTISGSNTSFTAATPVVSLTNSLNPSEVIDASSVNVLSDTELEADFSIPLNATEGMWDVNVDDLSLVEGFEVILLVGIEETQFSKLEVYPNPSDGILNISISEDAQVYVLNASGNRVDNFEARNGNNILDLTGLPSGIYFIQIRTNLKTEYRKIIIR